MHPSRQIEDLDAPAPPAATVVSWVIEVAARHARNGGVEVRIVLPRAPGVVAAVRDAAVAADIGVRTTIKSDHVTAVFGARSEGADTRTPAPSIQ